MGQSVNIQPDTIIDQVGGQIFKADNGATHDQERLSSSGSVNMMLQPPGMRSESRTHEPFGNSIPGQEVYGRNSRMVVQLDPESFKQQPQQQQQLQHPYHHSDSICMTNPNIVQSRSKLTTNFDGTDRSAIQSHMQQRGEPVPAVSQEQMYWQSCNPKQVVGPPSDLCTIEDAQNTFNQIIYAFS